jgi:predicted polyphosphate/ATP-dependent NAD kinase
MNRDPLPAVGVIANPASGRDMRRLLGWASVFPTAEKVNVVLRLLSAMGSLGVQQAWMPPDAAGIAERVREAADLARTRRGLEMPLVRLLDMRRSDSAADSTEAAALMRAHGAALIAVLGGDGTHRAVAKGCADLPLATLSTGTNNAFPEWGEATSVGLASALVISGRVPQAIAIRANKRLRVRGAGVDDVALVDVCLTRQLDIGGRAVWRSEDLVDLYAAFAEPTAIGLSAIAGLAHPVSRDDRFGIHVRFGAGRVLAAPLMPGTMARVSVTSVHRLDPGAPLRLRALRGTLALDGEREIEIGPERELSLELDWSGPRTVAVGAVLAYAAQKGLLLSDPGGMEFHP